MLSQSTHERKPLGDAIARVVPLVLLALGVTATFAVAAPTARAQFSSLSIQPIDEEWRYTATAVFERQWEAEIDGGDKFDYTTGSVAGTMMGPMGPNLLLGVSGTYTFTEYGFRLELQDNSFPAYSNSDLPKDPWGGVNTVDSAILGAYVIDEAFSIVAAVPISYSAEVGSDQNAVTAGIVAGLQYRLEDRLALVLGVGVMSEIEGSERVFPIFGLDYRVTDSFRLRTRGAFTEGGQLAAVFGVSSKAELELSVGYERRRFRLDRHGGAPTTPRRGNDTDGVGEYRAVPIMAAIRLDIYQGVVASIEGGLAFAGQLRVENSDGRELFEQNFDPAPRLNVNIMIPF